MSLDAVTPDTHAVEFETPTGAELVELESPIAAAMLYDALRFLTRRPMRLILYGEAIEERGWIQ